jgi:hypothetical protein
VQFGGGFDVEAGRVFGLPGDVLVGADQQELGPRYPLGCRGITPATIGSG